MELNTINPAILKILKSEATLTRIKLAYKEQLLRTGKKPNLVELFKSAGVGQTRYSQIKRIVGNSDLLHDYLVRDEAVEVSLVQSLLKSTIESLSNDLSNMSPKERIDLLQTLSKFAVPDPAIQVNNNVIVEDWMKSRGL